MVLSDLNLDIEYSSECSDLLNDFYRPCFSSSNLYCRAVGYFTSDGLSLITPGMASFLRTGGKIRLIASPKLAEEDVEAINRGYKSREQVIGDAFEQSIEKNVTNEHLNLLSWLIAKGILDIKLALKVNDQGKLTRGFFHEKFGYFRDKADGKVAFTGSANETVGGLIENQESIDVYWSWDDPHRRVQRKVDRFESLWENRPESLDVIDFTEATSEILKPYKSSFEPTLTLTDLSSSRNGQRFALPESISLRGYQRQAINNWFKNNGRGIFQLATGTGKTITALALGSALYDKIALQWLIVVCPYKHLVSQWAEECRNFGCEPILAFENTKKWSAQLDGQLLESSFQQNEKSNLKVVITTTSTFVRESFQSKLNHFPDKTLLVADEVHNMGAKNIRNVLPDSIGMRLGLSATPERWHDDEGTENLVSYFGKILEPKLGIADAIRMNVLTPYRYYPVLVELSDDEHDEYLELSEKIAKLMHVNEDSEGLRLLLIKRARLMASAVNKLDALRQLAHSMTSDSHMLFYCGDGSVDSEADISEIRQIEAVTKILGADLGMKVSQYTAETSLKDREHLKTTLALGVTQGLVAIRCLDEGVDIPTIKTAVILASSTNPRQFIQRRGRVLRKADGKKSATIYDMIVVPPDNDEILDADRKLIRKEIQRFVEFADLSLNAAEARLKLLPIQKKYGLLEL